MTNNMYLGMIIIFEGIINILYLIITNTKHKEEHEVLSVNKYSLIRFIYIQIISLFIFKPYGEIIPNINIYLITILIIILFALISYIVPGASRTIYFKDKEYLTKTIENTLNNRGYEYKIEDEHDRITFNIKDSLKSIMIIPSRKWKDDSIKNHTITFKYMKKLDVMDLNDDISKNIKEEKKDNETTFTISGIFFSLILIVFGVFIYAR